MAVVNMNAKYEPRGVYETIPPGDYFVRVKEVKDGTSKSGYQKVDLFLEVFDKSDKRVGGMWTNLTMIPLGKDGHGIWLHANHAFGLPYDGEVSFDTADYRGKTAYVKIGTRVYDGKTYNTIAEWYNEKTLAKVGDVLDTSAKPTDNKPSDLPF